MTGTPDPTQRFTRRVDDYVRYRPRYPASVIRVLEEDAGLEPGWMVADVGSGTGLSTELFLDNGNRVFAVEPNDEMRAAAERLLGDRPGFESVAGTAEDTGLTTGSVDLAVCAQAFHWFDPEGARREFARILRPPRPVALLWNTRLIESSAFQRDYEALLKRFGTDYEAVRHDRKDPTALSTFFAGGFTHRVVPNEQRFDYPGLEGRLLSSSYAPPPGDPAHEPMLRELRDLFDRNQSDGVVRMTYDTEILVGRVGEAP